MFKIKHWLKRSTLKLLPGRPGKEVIAPGDLPRSEIRKIVILIRSDALVDLLLTTPVFKAVRQGFPSAHIAVLTGNYTGQVLVNNPNIDEVIYLRKGLAFWSPANVIAFVKQLHAHFDLAIVLNPSAQIDWLAHFSGARYILGPEQAVETDDEAIGFYNLRAPRADAKQHVTERALAVVRHLGLDSSDKGAELSLTTEEKIRAIEFLKENFIQLGELVVAVHLGTGKFNQPWDVKNFIQVAKSFSTLHNAKIVVSWGPEDQQTGRAFLEGMPFTPVQANGLSLRELAAVYLFCSLLVCNYTGIMYLAASLGTPLVAVGGPPEPDDREPLGEEFVVLKGVHGDVSTIGPEQVMQRAAGLLRAYPKNIKDQQFDISEQVLEQYLNVLKTF